MSALPPPQAESAEVRTEHPHVIRVHNIAQISGTRLPVRLLAQMYRAGDTVDDILQTYPHLSAAAVHDAISYYLDHRAEIEQEIAEHRIEAALARANAHIDERGFITFLPANG